jgi:hypothetical protein
MRQKQVIDFLRHHEKPASPREIKTAIGLDIDAQPDLAQALNSNVKVGVDDDGYYFYRPDSNIRSKSELLEYVRKAAAPVTVPEIQDAYKAVAADIAALKREGVILGLHSYDPELQCEVLFPVDAKLTGMRVDADVAELWSQIEVPEEDDPLKAELVKIGLKPAPRKAPKKAVNANKEKRKKQRRQQRLRTVTNLHMMHLFEGDAPVGIEG